MTEALAHNAPLGPWHALLLGRRPQERLAADEPDKKPQARRALAQLRAFATSRWPWQPGRSTRADKTPLAATLIALAMLAALTAGGAVLYPRAAQKTAGTEATSQPLWNHTGPVLAAAQARGSLRVGVRAYPRPAPPGELPPAEPQDYDADLARYIAKHLGLQLELINWPPAPAAQLPWLSQVHAVATAIPDIVLQGADAEPGRQTNPQQLNSLAYDTAPGQLVVLRKSSITSVQTLAAQTVCLSKGSPYTTQLGQWGARPQIYPSSVHAVSAFMAGECTALAEHGQLIAQLLAQPPWRYYRALPAALPANNQARIQLASADAQSARWLDELVFRWRGNGQQALAAQHQRSAVLLEVAQLEDGAICH